MTILAERFVNFQFSSFLQYPPLRCSSVGNLSFSSLPSYTFHYTSSHYLHCIFSLFCVSPPHYLFIILLSFANSSHLLFSTPRVPTFRIESSLSKALAKEASKGKMTEVRRSKNIQKNLQNPSSCSFLSISCEKLSL